MDPQPLSVPRDGVLGLSGYHWLVIAAGWAGWGFDVFDAVLFNFVAPDCIPVLLHLPRGSHAAHQAAYGFSVTAEPTEIVNLRLAAIGRIPGTKQARSPQAPPR